MHSARADCGLMIVSRAERVSCIGQQQQQQQQQRRRRRRQW